MFQFLDLFLHDAYVFVGTIFNLSVIVGFVLWANKSLKGG